MKKKNNILIKKTLNSDIFEANEEHDLDKFIYELKQIRKKHDKKWDDLYIKIELDYDNCYYNDQPHIKCKLIGHKTRPETDKEYEKRCENKQQNNNKKEEKPLWPTAMHGGNGLDG